MMSQVAGLLVELALKSTVVLGVAFALAAALRRFSSEERHVVFAVALVGLLALPLLTVFGPAVELSVPERLAPAATAPASTEPGARQASPSSGSRTPGGAQHGPRTGPAADGNASTGANRTFSAFLTPFQAWISRSGSAAALATIMYLTIALLLLARYAVAVIAITRSLRRLEAVTEPSVIALCADLRSRLYLRRRVRLVVSRTEATPWAWGVFHPVVVLPENFAQLPVESQRDALVHELAHVVRLDFASTLLGCVSCSLYWFQPLVWLALRRMARESEHACDDRVLLAGGSRATYASQLLDLASTIHRRRQPILATAMAEPSSISGRITSILDPTTRRRTMNKRKVCSALVLWGMLVAPLAALQSREAPPVGDPADAGFQAPVEQGPANSDQLGLLVRTYVEHGRQAEAVETLADYLSRDPAGTAGETGDPHCAFCRSVLENEGAQAPGDLSAAVLAAFDEVERRARDAGDGDLLIRLAVISGASSNAGGAAGRGTFYLVEGFRLGNLEDASKLEAVRFLDDLGWYPQAKALADRLYGDQASSLYQSPEVQAWIWQLDFKLSQRDDITQRLMTPNGSFAYTEDVVPVYRQAPVYPPEALRHGRQAEVQLEFTITAEGRTADIVVVHSSDSGFNDAAVKSLSQWRYLPQVVNGTAVEKKGVQTMMRFLLES